MPLPTRVGKLGEVIVGSKHTKQVQGWSECGWPRRVTEANKHIPPQPCGRRTIDGIQCALHAKIAATRAALQAGGGE